MAHELAALGGLTFAFAFLHFVVDWGFQSHAEAMQKATHWRVRARHCLVYTLGFVPPLWFLLDWRGFASSLVLLWVSHFLIDTYVPVYVWAKYLRRPPAMQGPPSELEGFKAFAKEPLGLFLVVAMDQAWHIAFLFPVAFLALYPQNLPIFVIVGVISLLGLTGLTWFGFRKLGSLAK